MGDHIVRLDCIYKGGMGQLLTATENIWRVELERNMQSFVATIQCLLLTTSTVGVFNVHDDDTLQPPTTTQCLLLMKSTVGVFHVCEHDTLQRLLSACCLRNLQQVYLTCVNMTLSTNITQYDLKTSYPCYKRHHPHRIRQAKFAKISYIINGTDINLLNRDIQSGMY